MKRSTRGQSSKHHSMHKGMHNSIHDSMHDSMHDIMQNISTVASIKACIAAIINRPSAGRQNLPNSGQDPPSWNGQAPEHRSRGEQ